jgi:hypothetical protein
MVGTVAGDMEEEGVEEVVVVVEGAGGGEAVEGVEEVAS